MCKLGLAQLAFGDDLHLFAHGDLDSIMPLWKCFNKFSKLSGLHANAKKSDLYLRGADAYEKQRIFGTIGFAIGTSPFRYLGLPMSSKSLSHKMCQPLLDKISQRISSWTMKKLTYAGRKSVIAVVLSNLVNFWGSILVLPKCAMKAI